MIGRMKPPLPQCYRRNLTAVLCAVMALAGCREDAGRVAPAPVELTADAAGYYCQMTLLDHIGPKGQIHLDGLSAPLFFAQVKDAIAYLHMPEQSHAVRASYVQDMSGTATWSAPGAWVPAEQAYYVIGSDASGGMEAAEFVPFAIQDDARAFARTHGGEVRSFSQISRADALAPSGAVPPDAAGAGHDKDDIAGRLKALSGPSRSN